MHPIQILRLNVESMDAQRPEQYNKMNSFRRHIHRKHEEEMSAAETSNLLPNDSQGDNHTLEMSSNNSSETSTDTDSEDDNPTVEVDVNQTDKAVDLKQCSAQFLLKLQARSKIPKLEYALKKIDTGRKK
ncbi:uncharacterized protein LOC114530075 [Dendronephthya gigantea]|uniref:uncharacterized protein LOC114530075 n=1 Tax=Dendronephthya gigantea TaxID=151771 RepID=UPI00106D51FB|nr:uncharacterized protein LOC114530075 [Dendronephthya gigantea]